jgi:hypothetical protein
LTSKNARFAWDRADAWLGLGTMGLLVIFAKVSSSGDTVTPAVRSLTTFAFLLQPYMVARVVRHYRAVPAWLQYGLLGAAFIGMAFGLFGPKNIGLRYIFTTVILVTQATASVILLLAARRHVGLTAWRLRTAALGVLLFGVLLATSIFSVPTHDSRLRPIARPFMKVLPITMLAAYYIGLLPPGLFRGMLQRGE